jgi:glycolate oxidase
MPYGDEKHNLIHQELVNILGEDNVRNGTATMTAYSRCLFAVSTLNRKRKPEFVVLPKNTEDIQRIMQLAIRYEFPYSIMGSGVMMPLHGTAKRYWCIIDPKRMNRVEIDEKNMFAVIEPYVTHAQLQAEAMQRGLFNGIPLVGAQAMALANHVWHGWHGSAYRTGFATRNSLGMEWVLPTGQVITTGSLSIPSAGYFWGEGPGPDLRNLRKGLVSENGSFGIITRLAIKLHPWPGPKYFPVADIRPLKTSELPDDFQWHFISYPTEKACADAMYAIGKAEIGGIMQRWGTQLIAWEYAKSNEEYLRLLEEGYWRKECLNLVAICLFPFASAQQTTYEEKVLTRIIKETGGQEVSQEIYDKLKPFIANTLIRNNYGFRWTRPGNTMHTSMLFADSLDAVFDAQEEHWKHIAGYRPPFLDDNGESAWVLPFDFCHSGGCTVDQSHEKIDEVCQEVMKEAMEWLQHDINAGTCAFTTNLAPADIVGPKFANYHLPLAKIKKALDPKNLANPGRFIDVARVEKAEAAKAEQAKAESEKTKGE